MRKFIRTHILKNINKRLHFWKVFCENEFLKIFENDLLCVRLLKLVKIKKNVSYTKVLGEERKD